MAYGVEQNVPWGEYGRTNFYTRAPQTYRDVALAMGLNPGALQTNLQGMYDPNSAFYSGLENSIGSYYDRAQNDYLKYINDLTGGVSNTPTTIADVLSQRGGGSLETGTANQITDLASMEAAGAQAAIEKALSSFIPSQKASLRARSGATRSLSNPDWSDQSLKAAWAIPVANAASNQYSNSSQMARQQIANVAQGNNDLLRQFALTGAQMGGNIALERARAMAGLRNTGLGYLASIGQGLLQGAVNPQTFQLQSFGPAGVNMLGTMTNPTGGFGGGASENNKNNNNNSNNTGNSAPVQGAAGGGMSAYSMIANNAIASNRDGSYTMPDGSRVMYSGPGSAPGAAPPSGGADPSK